MSRHKYCCQNELQNYYDHIITVPDDFKVKPEFLGGMESNDFIKGLKALTETVKNIYADMIENPAEYGLPLYADMKDGIPDKKANDARNSAKRLVSLFKIFSSAGELSDGKIIADRKAVSEKNKKLTPLYKITQADKFIKNLEKFGFAYDGTALSHEDSHIISVLYNFMKNIELRPGFSASYSFAYYTAADGNSDDLYPAYFAQHLSGKDREFFLHLNDSLLKIESVIRNGAEYFVYAKKQRWLVRCNSDYGQLTVTMKLHNSGGYGEYLESLPERVKHVFRRDKPISCGFCEKCWNTKLYRTFEGIEYIECGHENRFTVAVNEPDDADLYAQIIANEVKALKESK